jgi:hypothetical protein
MRNRLGAARINEAVENGKVRHFNTGKDPISQFGEGRRFGLDASSQVGVRYLIPNSKGHSLKHSVAGLDTVADRTPRLAPSELLKLGYS